MTLIKRRAKGAKRTIWRTELTATRMAQYSLSPPARPVQISTMAMQRARPTRMRPLRSPSSSGRKAHASANLRFVSEGLLSIWELKRTYHK